MKKNLILSIAADDRPGIVAYLSSEIEACGANWLESRLAQLGGKFAGVVLVSVEGGREQELRNKLKGLDKEDIRVSIESLPEPTARPQNKQADFSIMGPDRTGIIKEITQAFAQRAINIEELESELSSLPYSGEPVFEARGTLSMSADFDFQELQSRMDEIANELGLDLHVEAAKPR